MKALWRFSLTSILVWSSSNSFTCYSRTDGSIKKLLLTFCRHCLKSISANFGKNLTNCLGWFRKKRVFSNNSKLAKIFLTCWNVSFGVHSPRHEARNKGAFTSDANEALRANDLHVKSMQRRNRQSCSAIRANEALTNQELALAVTWLRAEAPKQSETTMEDKLFVVVCGYPELYDTTSYFYRNRNTFCNETGATWQKPLPWREFVSVV